MGKSDLAHRHVGSGAASGMNRVLGNQLGEDLNVAWTNPWTSVLPSVPRRDWSQQSLWSLSSGTQASVPACHAGLGRWGWAKLLGGWVVGGRGSGSSYLSHPPLVVHVGADPLPARKSQTQRSDIWEALDSQGIFRRPEADMPGILGVAEPKKLGGQWRVNQKRWPRSWFLLH